MATDGMVRRWNSVAYSGVDERRLDSVLAMPGPSSEPFSVLGGRRVNGAGLAASVGTGPDSVTVAAGGGIVYDSTYAAGGGWEFALAASKTVNLAARPGSGLSRIDLVIARIYDPDSSVGAVRELKIEVVAGTASASPAAPALPALSLELARLTVPNVAAVSSTHSTARTVAAGGVLPVSTTAARDALVGDGIAYPGMAVFNQQVGALQVRTDSGWDSYAKAENTGQVACTAVGGFTSNVLAQIRDGVLFLDGYLQRPSSYSPNLTACINLPTTGGFTGISTRLGGSTRYIVASPPTTGTEISVRAAISGPQILIAMTAPNSSAIHVGGNAIPLDGA